jgi:hypothetical protein
LIINIIMHVVVWRSLDRNSIVESFLWIFLIFEIVVDGCILDQSIRMFRRRRNMVEYLK